MSESSYLSDPGRLHAVDESRLFGSQSEEVFDRFTAMAARLLKASVCFFSIVTADRVYYKSQFGMPEPLASQREAPIEYSLCQHVVTGGKSLAVPDTLLHPAVQCNPAVTTLGARCFAGAPIYAPDRKIIGSLCALDFTARAWTPDDILVLEELSVAISVELSLRQELRDKQRIEEELRVSEARFRSLVESSPDLIWELDSLGNLRYVNQACETILGWQCSEVQGANWKKLRPQRDPFIAAAARGLADGKAFQGLELHAHRRDGSQVTLECSGTPLLDGSGRLEGILGISRDISVKEKMGTFLRERLQDSAEEIEQVNRSLSRAHRMARLANWTWDGPGLPFHWEEGAQELLNALTLQKIKSSEEVLKRVACEDREEFGCALLECHKTGKVVDCRFTFQAEGEETLVLRAMAEGVARADGTFSVVGTFQNVTEQEALQNQLRQSQKMDAVGHMASGIAHDFNNLLCGITGFAEFALEDLDPSQSAHDDVMEVLKTARRAEDLTRQLLLFSSHTVSSKTDLKLNVIVEDISRMLERLIGENIHLTSQLATDLWSVRADRSSIEQVLVNLAVNARDAMSEGGHLRIKTSNASISKQLTSHYQTIEGDYVVLEVSDEGSGIPPHILPRVFEPFFTTKAPGRGTGLGLSVCFGILEEVGGAIHVSSSPTDGTRFSLYFPRHKVSSDSLPVSEAPPEAPVSQQETILLVEDEELVRATVVRILGKLGYKVCPYPNAEDALLALPHLPTPDLLLTDCVLPGMTGIELVRQVGLVRPTLKTLIMSAYLPEDSNNITNSVLLKPFGRERLASAIRAALD